MPKRKRSSMSKISEKTKAQVDKELKDDELSILRSANIDWNALKPKISEKEIYEKLIAAVKESTERNESISELKSRIMNLGKGTLKVVKEVVDLLR